MFARRAIARVGSHLVRAATKPRVRKFSALAGPNRGFQRARAPSALTRSFSTGAATEGPTAGSDNADAGDNGSSSAEQLPFILDVDAGNIEQVMVQSYGVPTILDFHADWCGPCKQLGPLLEDAVKKAGGKIRLAKIDIDKNQQLAGMMRVQSIPTVYGIVDGKVSDNFVGLPAPDALESFLQKLVAQARDPSASPGAGTDEAPQTPAAIYERGLQALKAGDFGTAKNSFSTVIALEESEAEALAAKAEREGSRKITQKSDEQRQLEEVAAAAHASLSQTKLMEGDVDGAVKYVADMQNQPKWSKYLHSPNVAQPLAIVELYANTDGVETDPAAIRAALVW